MPSARFPTRHLEKPETELQSFRSIGESEKPSPCPTQERHGPKARAFLFIASLPLSFHAVAQTQGSERHHPINCPGSSELVRALAGQVDHSGITKPTCPVDATLNYHKVLGSTHSPPSTYSLTQES